MTSTEPPTRLSDFGKRTNAYAYSLRIWKQPQRLTVFVCHLGFFNWNRRCVVSDDDLKKLMLAIASGLEKISEQLASLEEANRRTMGAIERIDNRQWREGMRRT